MKAPAFDYVKPKDLSEALRLLQQYGAGAQVLAGGQSLLAMLNLRMANPSILIDISGINTMKGIEKLGNTLRIGALTTHNDILNSDLVKLHVPLLAQAVPYVAHLAIRNKGTIGGSLALGDPAAASRG